MLGGEELVRQFLRLILFCQLLCISLRRLDQQIVFFKQLVVNRPVLRVRIVNPVDFGEF